MDARERIDKVFQSRAFLRPLFYQYEGGLRFELSEGVDAVSQFLSALRKAERICADVFDPHGRLLVCLRSRPVMSAHALRESLRQLKGAGIAVPRERCLWAELLSAEERFDEGVEEWVAALAFELPASRLPNLLWCAFSSDFAGIAPRPLCDVYLFDLERQVMVFPYDDRGMDVVGPNHALLSRLYAKHYDSLLAHDLEAMRRTFTSD